MLTPDPELFRKHIRLSALGAALQMAGSICLAAAAIGAVKELNTQIKKALVEKLSEEV